MVDLFNCKKGVKFFMKCLFTKVHQFYISPNFPYWICTGRLAHHLGRPGIVCQNKLHISILLMIMLIILHMQYWKWNNITCNIIKCNTSKIREKLKILYDLLAYIFTLFLSSILPLNFLIPSPLHLQNLKCLTLPGRPVTKIGGCMSCFLAFFKLFNCKWYTEFINK